MKKTKAKGQATVKDQNKPKRALDTFIDCMPNPFKCRTLKLQGFDINFYRKS